MRKIMLFLLVASIIFGGLGESVWAQSCDYCSEANCSNYLLCEDFDAGGVPTDWHCDNHTDFNCDSCSEQDYRHDLSILGSHTDCSIWYGKVTANYGIDGTNCFESDVVSVADCQGYGGPNCTTAPACNGCHGGGFKAWVSEDPLPAELWVRWYIYIPDENYDGAGDHHCNHHVFLDNGAGAYPSIDIRSTYEIPGYSGAQQHLWIGVHHSDANGEKFLSKPEWYLEEHLDEWICLEWYLNNNTNRMRFWVNGEEHVDDSDWSNWSQDKLMNGFLIGQYNCDNNDVGTTWKMYVDNVVVSTTGYIGPAESSVIFEENFEYGQDACGSDLFSLPGFTSIWNGGQARMPHISATACVNTLQARSGTRSIRWEFPYDDGADCFLEANHDYGSDVWIEFYFFPSRMGDYISSTTNGNTGKLIYAYTSATGPSIWCLTQSVDNWASHTCDWHDWAENIIGAEGMSLIYVGPGAATQRSGYNLGNVKLLQWNTWNRVILHTQYIGADDSRLELWIDNKNGDGLEKVWDHNLSGECDWDAGGTTCGRLKFGLMNTQAPGYYYFDDIKIATSPDDMNWGVNDTTTRSNGHPTGTLSSGTTTANISLETNVQATCRYSNNSNTNYSDMPFNFTSTNPTNHSTTVTGLENGKTYTFYVRCNSTEGYVNEDDFNITFSVDGHRADLNDDGLINMPELMAFIARWKASDGVTRQEVLDAREIWFTGGVY